MKTVEGFRLRSIVGESILVGECVGLIDFNKLISLNSSAAFLWQSIEGKEFIVNDLVMILVDKYGVSTEIAMKDACAIVNEWIVNGLIEE